MAKSWESLFLLNEQIALLGEMETWVLGRGPRRCDQQTFEVSRARSTLTGPPDEHPRLRPLLGFIQKLSTQMHCLWPTMRYGRQLSRIMIDKIINNGISNSTPARTSMGGPA